MCSAPRNTTEQSRAGFTLWSLGSESTCFSILLDNWGPGQLGACISLRGAGHSLWWATYSSSLIHPNSCCSLFFLVSVLLKTTNPSVKTEEVSPSSRRPQPLAESNSQQQRETSTHCFITGLSTFSQEPHQATHAHIQFPKYLQHVGCSPRSLAGTELNRYSQSLTLRIPRWSVMASGFQARQVMNFILKGFSEFTRSNIPILQMTVLFQYLLGARQCSRDF